MLSSRATPRWLQFLWYLLLILKCLMLLILGTLQDLLTQWNRICHFFDQLLFQIIVFNYATTSLLFVSVAFWFHLEHLDWVALAHLAKVIQVVVHVKQRVFRLDSKSFKILLNLLGLPPNLNDELWLVCLRILLFLGKIQKFECHRRVNELTLRASVF